MKLNSVWLFHGENGRFASAAFASINHAEVWIKKYGLTGILTEYPIDISVYDWSIDNGLFELKKDVHSSSSFIQTFTSASQEHFHYENGLKE